MIKGQQTESWLWVLWCWGIRVESLEFGVCIEAVVLVCWKINSKTHLQTIERWFVRDAILSPTLWGSQSVFGESGQTRESRTSRRCRQECIAVTSWMPIVSTRTTGHWCGYCCDWGERLLIDLFNWLIHVQAMIKSLSLSSIKQSNRSYQEVQDDLLKKASAFSESTTYVL